MTTSGSDAAETMVRMALSGAEVSVKLTASAAKNLLPSPLRWRGITKSCTEK